MSHAALVTGQPTTKVIEYVDPIERFRGYLAYAGLERPLAAGGLRIQPGLDGPLVAALAEDMLLKQRVLQTNVDGAKCGIDYDPHSPGASAALRRFVAFLRPHMTSRLSLGPDMGTTWPQLRRAARDAGISSPKVAIAAAQGLTAEQLETRMRLLDTQLGALTIAERRAGHAAAHATIELLGVDVARRRPTAAVQGFGTLGKAAALSLHEAGVRVCAVSDRRRSLWKSDGLHVPSLISASSGTLLPAAADATHADRDALLLRNVDAIVLAACEDAMTSDHAASVQASSVIVGANHGLAPDVEHRLYDRGIDVLPDFIGGIGGSASVDVLFAPEIAPAAHEILPGVAALVRAITRHIIQAARIERLPPRHVATRLAIEQHVPVDVKPYGLRALTGSLRVRTA